MTLTEKNRIYKNYAVLISVASGLSHNFLTDSKRNLDENRLKGLKTAITKFLNCFILYPKMKK